MSKQEGEGRPPRLTRKQRRELGRRICSNNPGLDIVHPKAAGIDVGSREHYVAVSPDRDPEPVRCLGCFTADWQQLADWLEACGVQTVVLQSTGVYGIPVYDVLEQRGFEVWLVNAQQTKNLPGRKSDVQESQWLLKLHTYGLRRRSFRPGAEIRRVRTCWRERGQYVQQAGECMQRMQKALTQMNVQLPAVLSDLSGWTGQRILRAIVAGERDGKRLAEMKDPRVRATEEEIARSLEGTWLPEQLAVLKRQLEDYDHFQRQIAACDQDLQTWLRELPTTEVSPAESSGAAGRKRSKRKKGSRNEPAFDLGKELQRITGADLTRIDGLDVITAQTVIAEAGLDMSRWATEHHFVSWLGFCPRNDISGGKVLSRKSLKVVSRLATALRMAACSLLRSDSYLGAQYRRLRAKLGAPKALTAMAAKLARLIYRMLRYGQEYVDKGAALYEEKYRQQQLKLLHKKAAQHGFVLVPKAA